MDPGHSWIEVERKTLICCWRYFTLTNDQDTFGVG